MKLGLSITNINKSIENLRSFGLEIENDFKGQIIESGYKIRDRARQILSNESSKRTNQRYWTGSLHDSIKSNVTKTEGNITGVSIGPDLREVPYAEWVEVGHYVGYDKKWWEGYHYMDQAYSQLADSIPSEIAKTLTVSLKKFNVKSVQSTPAQARSARTGRFVSGRSSFTVE